MTWFRIDDSFGSHPKVLGIPRKDRPAAVGLWTMAGVWCARNLTDGILGVHMVDEIGVPTKYGSILVKAKLWHPPGEDCPACLDCAMTHQAQLLPASDGFRYHKWHEYQPARAAVEKVRREDRERKAAARAAKAAQRAAAGQTNVIPYDARSAGNP